MLESCLLLVNRPKRNDFRQLELKGNMFIDAYFNLLLLQGLDKMRRQAQRKIARVVTWLRSF